MNKGQVVNFTLSELIDKLTISQIREMLLPWGNTKYYAQELIDIEQDIGLLIKQKRVKISSDFMRKLILLSQINLHVWFIKDKMASNPRKYFKLLKFAQELNGIRNHIKNQLLYKTKDTALAKRRSTFLDYKNKKWYSSLLMDLSR